MKSAKNILRKCHQSGSGPDYMLYEWRNARMASALLKFFMVVDNTPLYLFFLAKINLSIFTMRQFLRTNYMLYRSRYTISTKLLFLLYNPANVLAFRIQRLLCGTLLVPFFLSGRTCYHKTYWLLTGLSFVHAVFCVHLPRSIYLLHLQILLGLHLHLLYDALLVFTLMLVLLLFTLLLLLLPHLRHHQEILSVPTRLFSSPSEALSLPPPSTTLLPPPPAASLGAPPTIPTPLPCSTSRRPRLSPSRTSSIPAIPKPLNSTKKDALPAATPSVVKIPRPMISVRDYNLAGLAARHSRPGSISRLVVHF